MGKLSWIEKLARISVSIIAGKTIESNKLRLLIHLIIPTSFLYNFKPGEKRKKNL